MNIPAHLSTLASAGLLIQRDISMRQFTTWKIGGSADGIVEATSLSQLAQALHATRRAGIPTLIMGRGSNLLFADEGFRGIVFRVDTPCNHIEVRGNQLIAEAGALACRVALAACRHGLTGLEHISGIPGTLGGLLAMNGGSLRKCIGDSVEWVEGFTADATPFHYERTDCQFQYRDSRFLQDPTLLISKCALRLPSGNRDEIRRAMLANWKERRQKFPHKIPNCGSVFKSSPELFAKAGPPGKIIEDCGFKGKRVGDAQVSPLHANFIVNHGNAKASDVLTLIHQIREAVHARFALWPETEVRFVPKNGNIIPAHNANTF